jgi:hypothetical protein
VWVLDMKTGSSSLVCIPFRASLAPIAPWANLSWSPPSQVLLPSPFLLPARWHLHVFESVNGPCPVLSPALSYGVLRGCAYYIHGLHSVLCVIHTQLTTE